jgi:hypothetical protein
MTPGQPPQDDDEPWSTAAEHEERVERAHLYRHQLLFLLGILLGMIGGFVTGANLVAGAGLFALAALCWALSGVSAIAARRHMFGSTGPSGAGNVRVRASARSPRGSAIVGVLLILLSLGLVNVAAHLLSTPLANPETPSAP